ncbi:hypothetical protein SASPL_136429 [Salvia splendens]|uniref:Uncharacterized protein n=1 Tax=Salvia splendens TaxID=180675 RepID=A0A8X8ZHI6_SALSN|nr:hypothetical protein SASPL_136429 [Salvia splendens]
MLRQSPRRNQRSKGMKVKHVLQVSVLLGVCIWLVLYQMPHPSDAGSFSQHGIKLSQKLLAAGDIKLGRKDLKPRTTTLGEGVQRVKGATEDYSASPKASEEAESPSPTLAK